MLKMCFVGIFDVSLCEFLQIAILCTGVSGVLMWIESL